MANIEANETEYKKTALKQLVQYLVDSCNEVADAIQDIDDDKEFTSQVKKLKKMMKHIQHMNNTPTTKEDKPKRKLSAYNNFMKERISTFEKYTFMTSKERFAKAASEWRQLSAEEKAKYK